MQEDQKFAKFMMNEISSSEQNQLLKKAYTIINDQRDETTNEELQTL
jgi:hypothetical protein